MKYNTKNKNKKTKLIKSENGKKWIYKKKKKRN